MRNIVYFIGAGLTKSLELPGKPVPLMWDFVSVMADHLDSEVILTTLVQLDRYGVYEWPSKEAAHLAEKLGRQRPSDPTLREEYRWTLKNRPAESIEALLQRAPQRGGDDSVQELLRRFNYAINQVFCRVGWDLNSGPLESFLQRQFAMPDARHGFVSYNYDVALDRAVQRVSSGGWHPAGGYGFTVPYWVEGDPPPEADGAAGGVPARPLSPPAAGPSRTTILKPHGSLNWLLPYKIPNQRRSCAFEFEPGPVSVPLTKAGELRYWPSSERFQRVSYPNQLPQEVGLCILPPVPCKPAGLPFLEDTRRLETRAIAEADECYVIGWSMPATDIGQECLIRCAIQDRTTELEKVVVVNRGAPPEYFKRVADVFGVDTPKLTIFNCGFRDFVQQALT